MEENTEVIEETTPEAIVIEEKSLGQEIVEALVVGIVSGVGTLAGFYAFGWAATKNEKFQTKRAAKKAEASDIVESTTEESDPVNTEEK